MFWLSKLHGENEGGGLSKKSPPDVKSKIKISVTNDHMVGLRINLIFTINEIKAQ